MRLARKSIENKAPADSALRLDLFSGELTEFISSLFAEYGRSLLCGSCYPNPLGERPWRLSFAAVETRRRRFMWKLGVSSVNSAMDIVRLWRDGVVKSRGDCCSCNPLDFLEACKSTLAGHFFGLDPAELQPS